MNLLFVATKAPWPPSDGGRLLLLNTLEAVAAATGRRPILVAPLDAAAAPAQTGLPKTAAALAAWCEPHLIPARPSPAPQALLRSWTGRVPLSVARHSLAPVRQEVERLLAGRKIDLVHAEQLQALPQTPWRRKTLPVVLRAQNVESDLWRETARRTLGWRGRALALEARRLARWEGQAVRWAAATLALTREDAARLRELSEGEGNVSVVRAPYKEEAGGTGPALPGNPAIVILGSRGWLPNEDSNAWFLTEVWPAVRAALPGAVLHLFGSDLPEDTAAAVVPHPSPRDSAEAFAAGSVLAVPLRIASGVRMKVLEAWARGIPVVGTPTALAGLEVEDGREALVAPDAAGFVRALTRFRDEPGLAPSLVAAGRKTLRERHDPARVAADLLSAYEAVCEPASARTAS